MTFQIPKWRTADIWRCIVAGCGKLWQVVAGRYTDLLSTYRYAALVQAERTEA